MADSFMLDRAFKHNAKLVQLINGRDPVMRKEKYTINRAFFVPVDGNGVAEQQVFLYRLVVFVAISWVSFEAFRKMLQLL